MEVSYKKRTKELDELSMTILKKKKEIEKIERKIKEGENRINSQYRTIVGTSQPKIQSEFNNDLLSWISQQIVAIWPESERDRQCNFITNIIFYRVRLF
jgi:hypothetical protein